MSRREWYREGRVPLHTLRAKIDYASPPLQPPWVPLVSRFGCTTVKFCRARRLRSPHSRVLPVLTVPVAAITIGVISNVGT